MHITRLVVPVAAVLLGACAASDQKPIVLEDQATTQSAAVPGGTSSGPVAASISGADSTLRVAVTQTVADGRVVVVARTPTRTVVVTPTATVGVTATVRVTDEVVVLRTPGRVTPPRSVPATTSSPTGN